MLVSLYIIFAVLVIALGVCTVLHCKEVIKRNNKEGKGNAMPTKHNDMEEKLNRQKEKVKKELDSLGIAYYDPGSGTESIFISNNKYNLSRVDIKEVAGIFSMSTWINTYYIGSFEIKDYDMSNLGLVTEVIKLQNEGFNVYQKDNKFFIENDEYKFNVTSSDFGYYFQLRIHLSYHEVNLTNVQEDMKTLINKLESDCIDLRDWVEDNKEINGYELKYYNKQVIAYKSVPIIFNIDLENEEVVIKRNGYVLNTLSINNIKEVTMIIKNRLTYLN